MISGQGWFINAWKASFPRFSQVLKGEEPAQRLTWIERCAMGQYLCPTDGAGWLVAGWQLKC